MKYLVIRNAKNSILNSLVGKKIFRASTTSDRFEAWKINQTRNTDFFLGS
ncbi:hypothetical protein IQ259_05515 [Fortiea sp. LEGE XX443]|nr:hypothetical protein [Fortiea sp. LEGE XX443]